MYDDLVRNGPVGSRHLWCAMYHAYWNTEGSTNSFNYSFLNLSP